MFLIKILSRWTKCWIDWKWILFNLSFKQFVKAKGYEIDNQDIKNFFKEYDFTSRYAQATHRRKGKDQFLKSNTSNIPLHVFSAGNYDLNYFLY